MKNLFGFSIYAPKGIGNVRRFRLRSHVVNGSLRAKHCAKIKRRVESKAVEKSIRYALPFLTTALANQEGKSYPKTHLGSMLAEQMRTTLGKQSYAPRFA